MATMVSPDNAPRTLEGLAELSRAVRYRLALNMSIVDSDPAADSTKAFLQSTPQVQCETLMSAFAMRDGGNGVQQQQQAPPQEQQQAPTGMQPTGQVTPGQMQPMGQVTPGQMQPMGQQQQPAPQTEQPAAQTQRTPATPADPTNAGAQATSTIVSPELEKKLDKILEELDGMPGLTETEELKELMLGSLRISRIMLLLCLEMAENTLGMDKETIIGMVAIASKSGEVEDLLAKTNEGKG